MSIALAVIGLLLIAAGLITTGRIPRHKSTGLVAIGVAFQLAYNIATHNQFWSGVATTGLVLLVPATVSYYRKDRKTGGVR
ncbi:hypothetical protein ACFYXD_35215 [Streptomyces platensis]|uniref:hypothetical protein n=1 Tax=Streptomyces platensis TaxID=58346 RepID=UPI0036CE00C8